MWPQWTCRRTLMASLDHTCCSVTPRNIRAPTLWGSTALVDHSSHLFLALATIYTSPHTAHNTGLPDPWEVGSPHFWGWGLTSGCLVSLNTKHRVRVRKSSLLLLPLCFLRNPTYKKSKRARPFAPKDGPDVCSAFVADMGMTRSQLYFVRGLLLRR